MTSSAAVAALAASASAVARADAGSGSTAHCAQPSARRVGWPRYPRPLAFVRRPDVALSVLDRLAVVLNANIPLARGLRMIADARGRPRVKACARSLLEDVEAGQMLSAAMARQPGVFDNVTQHAVYAAEQTGELAEVMLRAAHALERRRYIATRVRLALVYPAILLIVGAVVATTALALVPQTFKMMYEDMGIPLPAVTQWVISSSDALLWIAPGLPMLALIAWAVLQLPEVRWRLAQVAGILPVLGPWLATLSLSRFADAMGELLSSGLPFVDAFRVAIGAVDNAPVRAALLLAGEAIESGTVVSDAMRAHPPLKKLAALMEVREASGTLSEGFASYARHGYAAVEAAVNNTLKLLPIGSVLAVVALWGVFAIAFFLPMISLGQCMCI